jgi:hypothetical protein
MDFALAGSMGDRPFIEVELADARRDPATAPKWPTKQTSTWLVISVVAGDWAIASRIIIRFPFKSIAGNPEVATHPLEGTET